MKTETITPEEQNDLIRAQVDAEIPRPIGGFETEEERDAWQAQHEARFMELCSNMPQGDRTDEEWQKDYNFWCD